VSGLLEPPPWRLLPRRNEVLPEDLAFLGESTSTVCNGCGDCCDPVPFALTQDEVRAMLPSQIPPKLRRFILEDLTPIRRSEGLRRASYMTGGGQTWTWEKDGETGKPIENSAHVDVTHFYECRHFDRETRRCNNYEGRTWACAGYPWFGMKPDPAFSLPARCSFNADVGRPVAVSIERKD
jgi:Fe-S-cluster containining protein